MPQEDELWETTFGLIVVIFIIGMFLTSFGFFSSCEDRGYFSRPFCIVASFFAEEASEAAQPSVQDVHKPVVDGRESSKIQPNTKKVNDKIKESIIWVKYDVTGKTVDGSYFETAGTGSGVIVGNDNNELTVYTNRHVVDCQHNDINCFQRISESVQVRTQDGKFYDVDRISFSKADIDLAILKIKMPNAKDYSFAHYTPNFKQGDKVIAVGYPSYAENVVEFSVREGRITNIKDVLAQSSGRNFRAIESDAYTSFGSSGGGLFDALGNLVGINTWLTAKDAAKESIAIDFSSIQAEHFIHCDNNAYFSNGNCYKFCEREQVLGADRGCYDVCDGYYCESQIPQVNLQQCSDSTYVLGSDGYCHPACTMTTYCDQGAICYRNQCISCPYGTHLFEDETCRKYQ
jgi:S1-C subfamily serine protease